jgi:hypothetical protein
MRSVLTLLALGALLQQPPRYSVVQDGEAHGDPPYVIEEGWEPLLNGKDLAGWKACEPGAKDEWFTTRHGQTGRTANLCTERTFGDIELYLEFMLAKGSNSGVYLQGLYEIQIFDSWGSIEGMKTSDGGAIYHQWIDNRGVGGSPPLVNASRRPGEWQSYQAWFRAPRFDAAGKKIEPTRFQRVLFNGLPVQKDVDVDGPTRAHLEISEAAQGPLMIQGDHGPVALRNIYVRPLRPIILR